jgi:hypothetical protein
METITLISPPNGSVTEPLQRHPLPFDDDQVAIEEGGTGDAYAWDRLEIISSDRSVPRPVAFEWVRLPWHWRGTSYTLTISASADFSEHTTTHRGIGRSCVELWHLFIGTPYYWKVTAKRGAETIAESPVWRFVTNSLPPRWIRVPGITNARDIGGWPLPGNRRIRQGKVYRSSEMNGNLHLTPKGRELLEEELGLRTDLDLRNEGEAAAPALDPERVQWIHAPISPYDCICDAAFADAYRLIFETFADPMNYPIVFHCVGGADRGGTVAFLLNALLGKREEHLVRDYELTTLSVWGERSRTSEQFRGMLEALRAFGDDAKDIGRQVENFVLSIGLTPQHVARIREELIMPCPLIRQ